jgi:hypothetical protein
MPWLAGRCGPAAIPGVALAAIAAQASATINPNLAQLLKHRDGRLFMLFIMIYLLCIERN